MTGIKALDIILVGLAVLFTTAVMGFFVYTNMVFERPLPDNAKEFENLVHDSSKIQMQSAYEIKKLIINLRSSSKRLRFIDMDLHLVPYQADYISVVEENDSSIRDIIIDTTGRMTPTEVNSASGKTLLESRLVKRINMSLNKKIIKSILFSKFIVQ